MSDISYQAMVEALDCMIYVCSQDYRILFMNDKLIERTGGDTTGSLCYETLHNRDSVCPWCVNERVFRGETVRWEIRSPRDNRWYYIINTPIQRADGTICKQAMILDITDQKLIEDFSKKSREILEMVATGQELEITLRALTMTIEAIIPGCLCSILSLDPEGKHLFHLCAPSLPAEFVKTLNGMAVASTTCACCAAVFKKEVVITEDIETDPLWLNHRDFALRHGLRSSWSIPISNSSGRVIGCFALYHPNSSFPSQHDLSFCETAAHLAGIAMEAKESERALKRSEEKFRLVADYTYDWECWLGLDGRYIYVSPSCERITGYRADEFLSDPHLLQEIVHPEDRATVAEHEHGVREGDQAIRHMDFRIITRSGEKRWISHFSQPVYSEDGAYLGRRASNRDITERRIMDEKVRESAEKIKFFAFSVSHDLKSPTVAMYGLTRLLQERYGELLDERGKTYCDQIMRASEQIAALVEKINLYITAKETPLTLERVKLKEVFHIIREEFATQLTVREVRWTEPEAGPEIIAERLSLVRILRNLVDNALKYGGEGLSQITLGYEVSDEFHILSVKDDGVGIQLDDPGKVFEAFQRYEVSRGVEGTGLGLAIVKEIAEAHGGHVRIQSAYGKGATFFVTLPNRTAVPS